MVLKYSVELREKTKIPRLIWANLPWDCLLVVPSQDKTEHVEGLAAGQCITEVGSCALEVHCPQTTENQ